ncbi:pyrroline-5-carboxylate reductase [Zymomonas mobilis]|uniref:pyrroline-5-carboxylate reductase n=1 Tax=Zymomonas mobilis TaxID=542 RepID=UPI0003C7606F|nr:pyrroline-5-carboxylate reductase [Zymomonas mobilis]AHB09385.1 pyrroline-5-carboxylate reductase [Zymomonas mobilis subsp. mobilis str. CP4 = NRRL B-14023]AHJ69691.1 pyrroline-5-carboxylate reductase [Zymomonas mobilis subsp. mobilis NRRL B-12526]AHJ71547.1 pyrroline-5-carboxylate reductase [Zymomonas mobilis subsp. mobilis str. CP4 = NRRL B-14023]MCP9307876.1 pyrroline-5-carboxylate reductase [Zymomonas mobilis]
MSDTASDSAPLLPKDQAPFWAFGAGNMAGSMISCWLNNGLNPKDMLVIRPSGKPVAEGVKVVTSLPEDGSTPATLLLGVKPQMLPQIAPTLAPYITEKTTLISILAGVELETLRHFFPKAKSIVRAMPNLPVALGKGVVALCADKLTDEQRKCIEKLASTLGIFEWVNENQFDTATALAGCGPAFVYRFIDALAQAGQKLGLTADQALPMAIATVEGAASMAKQADITPAELADKVASPGGSTRKGMDVLDKDEALYQLMDATLEASFKQNRYMAEKAKETIAQ